MILTKYVDVKISNNQIKYYKEKGYEVKGGNEIISILAIDLPTRSVSKIKAKCDVCGEETIISYSRYNYNTKNSTTYYACSRKCSEQKSKNTNLEKYGVENVSNSQIIKDKKVETCLKNFGVEYPQQSKEINKKGHVSKLEKYGDANYTNPYKMKSTNLERYGVEYASQNAEISIKMRENQFISFKKNFDKGLYKSEIIRDRKDIFVGYLSNGQYEFKCDLHKDHHFNIDYKLLWNRINNKTILCTECNPISKNVSGLELQLLGFIKENYNDEIILNDRKILNPLELDIYLPNLKLAFEFNGLWWHNELNKDKDYHLNKTEECEKQGIQLIHIYEDDWIYNNEIIKSIILSKLNIFENVIDSKDCEIREVLDINLIKSYLEKNDIHGYIKSNIKIGLYLGNELISLMTFNIKNNNYEMISFSNKINTNIIDSEITLLNYFINKYSAKEIVCYFDRSFSQINLYKKIGFDFVDKVKPDYQYIIDNIRHNKCNFRKNKLVTEGFDINKTEHEIMLERKVYRIYDSGFLKFIYTLKK